MSFSVTAPKSLRELFDQIGLEEVPSTDGTVVMEMPVDERVTTDLFVRYLRPIKERNGPARAVAKILRTGKRSVVIQVDIYRGDDGELGATATVNFAAVG